MKLSTNNQLEHFDLTDKVAVITGGAGLLGRKHAEAIAECGGIPVIIDINQEKASKISHEINKFYGVQTLALKVDISKEKEVKNACTKIKEKFGRIDILINNAARNPAMSNNETQNLMRLENFPLKDWHQDLSIGLTGALICIKHFGSEIANSKNGGSIVNISSDLGIIAPDQRLYRQSKLKESEQPVKPVSYSVIKSGLIGLTRYVATYWGPQKVRCNALCPGGVFNDQSDILISRLENLIPLGRMADVDEYKGAIQFLCADASSYMTGTCLIIDGGRTCW